jgi:acylphosphatase
MNASRSNDGRRVGAEAGPCTKTLHERPRFGFIRRARSYGGGKERILPQPDKGLKLRAAGDMSRSRMQVIYSGYVQGVGFRYTVKSVAAGFEVTGTVRNLLDSRVELVAEGSREELEAFRKAIREAGLDHFIRGEEILWSEPTGGFRGFEIVR